MLIKPYSPVPTHCYLHAALQNGLLPVEKKTLSAATTIHTAGAGTDTTSSDSVYIYSKKNVVN